MVFNTVGRDHLGKSSVSQHDLMLLVHFLDFECTYKPLV